MPLRLNAAPAPVVVLAAILALTGCGAPDPAEPAETRTESAAPALLSAEQIEAGLPRPLQPAGATGDAARAPDPGLVRLQILLDRSPFSPGVIDGLSGENTRQAIAAWREAEGLPEDQDAVALVQRLAAADTAPVMTTYTLTAADLAGPFSPPAADLAAQAADGAHYASARERLAERFHITETLLRGLNPGVDFHTPGQTLVVPAVADRPLGEVVRIVVDKTGRSARAYDASGTLLAFYPATIGSSERPAPSGTLSVVGVANAPDYTYDPARLSYDRGDEKIVVPAGPNNPVGSVWIELSRDSYGIHGTPDPAKIAKTASNGCIRLTNWDAEQLAAAVKPGVEVEFI